MNTSVFSEAESRTLERIKDLEYSINPNTNPEKKKEISYMVRGMRDAIAIFRSVVE